MLYLQLPPLHDTSSLHLALSRHGFCVGLGLLVVETRDSSFCGEATTTAAAAGGRGWRRAAGEPKPRKCPSLSLLEKALASHGLVALSLAVPSLL